VKKKHFCFALLFILLTLAHNICLAEETIKTSKHYACAAELLSIMKMHKEKTSLETVKKLLKDATPAEINDLNMTNEEEPLLNLAIERTKSPAIIQYLIEKGADVNFSRGIYYSPLFKALINGKLEIAELLVKAGADVNCRDDYDTLLMKFTSWHTPWPGTDAFSSENEASEIISEFLLRHGADLKARRSEYGETVFLEAAQHTSSTKVLDMLIKYGAEVNETDDLGRTALFMAVENSNSNKIIRHLIKLGANVNARDDLGSTPLMDAAYSENLDAINTLIECGADITAKDNSGRNAVIYACAFACDFKGLPGEHLNPLFAKGIDINERDSDGQTAYYYVMRHYIPNPSLYMIEMGADTNIRLDNNMTPLMVSAGRAYSFKSGFPEDYTKELSALIERASNLNLQDDEGRTALIWAVLGYGEVPRESDTRLTIEVIVPMLLLAGADKSIKDNSGKLAYDYAIAMKELEGSKICEMLRLPLSYPVTKP